MTNCDLQDVRVVANISWCTSLFSVTGLVIDRLATLNASEVGQLVDTSLRYNSKL